MKRTLIVLGITICGAILAVVTLFIIAFSGTLPIVDGKLLTGGVRIVKDGIVSVAMIPAGEAAYVLVDCGNDAKATAIETELQRQKLSKDAVKAILLTHGHPDHINGCKAFPHAPILGLAAESPLLAGQGSVRSPLGKFMGQHDSGVRLTMPLRDGETFTLGPLKVTVYAIPGHTDGSAAYLAGGILFLGDSADAAKNGDLLAAKWLFSNDQRQNRASLKSLYRRLDAQAASIQWLVFSHSAPLETLAPLAKFSSKL